MVAGEGTGGTPPGEGEGEVCAQGEAESRCVEKVQSPRSIWASSIAWAHTTLPSLLYPSSYAYASLDLCPRKCANRVSGRRMAVSSLRVPCTGLSMPAARGDPAWQGKAARDTRKAEAPSGSADVL